MLTIMLAQTRSEKSFAFTLVELLAVIAIIALLAAILFPVFAQAREKARQASCLSNVRQIGLGALMYAQDNDETFPLYTWDYLTFWNGGRAGWGQPFQPERGLIFPYLKNKQIQQCPSYTGDKRLGGIGYGYASTIAGTYYDEQTYVLLSPASLAVLSKPAETLLFADSGNVTDAQADVPEKMRFGGQASDINLIEPPSSWCYAGYGCTASIQFRHQESANLVAADGHARSMKRAFWVQRLPAGQQPPGIIYQGDRWMQR